MICQYTYQISSAFYSEPFNNNCQQLLEDDVYSLFNHVLLIIFSDCQQFFTEDADDGLFILYENTIQAFMVYCIFDHTERVGWTVLMQRMETDKDVDFQQTWEDSKAGFGNLGIRGTFWLGLEYMSFLTLDRKMMLRVELVDIYDNHASAEVMIRTGAQ